MPARVSVIVPLHNGEKWLDECLESLFSQTYSGSVELCVYNDACSDQSIPILKRWSEKLRKRRIDVILTEGSSMRPQGKVTDFGKKNLFACRLLRQQRGCSCELVAWYVE